MYGLLFSGPSNPRTADSLQRSADAKDVNFYPKPETRWVITSLGKGMAILFTYG